MKIKVAVAIKKLLSAQGSREDEAEVIKEIEVAASECLQNFFEAAEDLVDHLSKKKYLDSSVDGFTVDAENVRYLNDRIKDSLGFYPLSPVCKLYHYVDCINYEEVLGISYKMSVTDSDLTSFKNKSDVAQQLLDLLTEPVELKPVAQPADNWAEGITWTVGSTAGGPGGSSWFDEIKRRKTT